MAGMDGGDGQRRGMVGMANSLQNAPCVCSLEQWDSDDPSAFRILGSHDYINDVGIPTL